MLDPDRLVRARRGIRSRCIERLCLGFGMCSLCQGGKRGFFLLLAGMLPRLVRLGMDSRVVRRRFRLCQHSVAE